MMKHLKQNAKWLIIQPNIETLNADSSLDRINDDASLMDLSVEVVCADQVGCDAEVIVAQSDSTIQQYPPKLALEAIEKSPTPRNQKLYIRKFNKNINDKEDIVYATWQFLKRLVENSRRLIDLPSSCEPHKRNDASQEYPLVRTGVIPATLADAIIPPKELMKHVTLIGKQYKLKARVLTSI